MCPDQELGLQGKTVSSFHGVHSVYQIFTGSQEKADLADSFASGLSAQALESGHLV